MKKIFLLFFFFTALLLVNCSDAPTEKQTADGMAKFANDSSFKDAHATPASMTFKGKGTMMDLRTPDGTLAKAYVVKAAEPTTKFLVVVQEWWGLNDHIKNEADRLADSLGNVTVIAPDLYDGKVATNPDEAGKFMEAVKPERCENILKGVLAYCGKDGEIATIGWCFGGGWSLRTSIMAAERGVGCVMYYGAPVEKADELAPLRADVLGIFAKKDGWINEEMIGKFQALAKATGKSVEVRWFDADHAFANPSNPKYDAKAAGEANALALAFLRKRLK